MKRILPRSEYEPGRRVYVSRLDVFGRLQIGNLQALTNSSLADTEWIVVCETPLPNYVHRINASDYDTIYDEAIETHYDD